MEQPAGVCNEVFSDENWGLFLVFARAAEVLSSNNCGSHFQMGSFADKATGNYACSHYVADTGIPFPFSLLLAISRCLTFVGYWVE